MSSWWVAPSCPTAYLCYNQLSSMIIYYTRISWTLAALWRETNTLNALTVAWVDPVCCDEVPFCEELCRPAAILAYFKARQSETRRQINALIQHLLILRHVTFTSGNRSNVIIILSGTSSFIWWLFADLLYSSQALELSRAQAVLLLEGGRLQHQMLLLSSVHLLQVLCCCVRLSV